MKRLLSFSLAAVALALLSFAHTAQAATPTLALSATGSGDYVQVDVTGDAGSSVLLHYQKTAGGNYMTALGTINTNGSFSTQISTSYYDISASSYVYVTVNNQSSASLEWPYNTSTSGGAITLSQTGTVLKIGNSTTLTVNNLGSNSLYLLNNTNPQVANTAISGTQLTLTGNTYGQTVVTVCVLGTTSNCASDYVMVQNTSATTLTFTQTNLTVAYGQSTTVTILNGSGSTGTGAYTILSNSNPSVIQASISSAVVTLTALANTGSASLIICTTDMSSCGIVTATAGSVNSSGLTFSQTSPSLTVGQSLNITLSGGNSYSISSNSNSSVASANINNTNILTVVGNTAGSSIITVCSSAGNCGSVTATVSYATSGAITLSQTSLWLQVGQSSNPVVISGGTMPYSLSASASSSSFATATLNNNILTLTGVAAGSSYLQVCSSGGACTQLSFLVNGVSTSGRLTFSNNNLSLIVGNSATVSLYGNSGYYISNTTNQNNASFTLSGSQITVNALTAGSANATICQTGGQCSVLYVSVTSTVSTATPPGFVNATPSVGVGQTVNVQVYGGASSNYYISSNSNPTIVQAVFSGNILELTGAQSGTSVLIVCAASNNCNSLPVTVTNAVTTSSSSSSSNSNSSSTSTTTSGTTASTGSSSDTTLTAITNEASIISGGNVSTIAGAVGVARSTASEKTNFTKYVNALVKGLKMTTAATNNINYFITYGTPTTKKIGAAERASILSSYLLAYSKLPVSSAQWLDLLKISQGYFPAAVSASAETQAKKEFVKIYKRAAVVTNSLDYSAIKMIAYGVRTLNRNTKSEQTATVKFRSVYGHAPVNTLAWNIVRAIAYSGVTK